MKITITLGRKNILDDIMSRCNILAKQLARNKETEEVAYDIMAPDDEETKPIVARALSEAFTEVKRKCQQYLLYGRLEDDNYLHAIDERTRYRESVEASPLITECKFGMTKDVLYDVSILSDEEITVMNGEEVIIAKGTDIHIKYKPTVINERFRLKAAKIISVDIVYTKGEFGKYVLELQMPKNYNVGMTESLQVSAHRMMVDYVMYNILRDQYAEKAQEYLENYTSDGNALRLALISRTTYTRKNAASWI